MSSRLKNRTMRTLAPITAMAVISLFVLRIGRAQSGSTATRAHAADSLAVVGVVDRYHRALSDGDSATALSLLAQDAVIIESGDVETRGEYRSHHLPADIAFARAVPSVRGPIRVVMHGDGAWAISTGKTQGVYRGRNIDSQGAELMVLTRDADHWRIRAIHWSSRPSRPSR